MRQSVIFVPNGGTTRKIFLVSIFLFSLSSLRSSVPERNHYPQQAGGFSGWQVSPDRGTLGVVIPATTVPGDIPIPVAFRFNATFAKLRAGLWKVQSTINSDNWKQVITNIDQPIEGSVHFGMILPQPGWDPFSVPGEAEAGRSLWAWVLEDGTQYSISDFTTAQVLSPSLFTAFQMGVKNSSVKIDSTGTVAFYSATSADLGNWAPKVASLTSGNNFNGQGSGPTGYQVVMDRDKARIFAFDFWANGWVPVLWVDRFNHYVQFNWTVGWPIAPYTNYRTCTVLNSRIPAQGLQLQTVSASDQAAHPLIRVDYIGIQAPCLQVTGYSGVAAQQPASLGGGNAVLGMARANDNVVRPTEVRMGQPGTATLSYPPWSQTVPVTSGEAWLSDRFWLFTPLDTQYAELVDITDPLGLKTTFSWTTHNLYSLSWTMNNTYRCVQTATSVDSQNGITRTTTYSQHLPATIDGGWWTTESTAWSGTTVIAGNPTPNVLTRNYATPMNQNYNNAAPSSIVLTNGPTTLSTTTLDLPQGAMYGQDGTLSFGGQSRATNYSGKQVAATRATSYPAGDTPNVSEATEIDLQTGRPKSISTTSAGLTDKVTYAYDSTGTTSVLDPKRLTKVDHTRSGGLSGSPGAAPTQVTEFDTATFLASKKYRLDSLGNNQMGQNITWDTASGRLKQVDDYASGSLFDASKGTVARVWTVDLNTGLPTSLSVTYNNPDPDPNFADSYSQAWPLASYDTADRPQCFTDGLGLTTTTTYFADGRVASIAKNGQGTIDFIYSNERTAKATQNGLTTTTVVDGFGRTLTRERGGDGVIETYFYDTDGQLAKFVETSTAGSKRTTLKSFDTRGRLSSITPPVGPKATYAYSLASGTYEGFQKVVTTLVDQSITTQVIIDPWGHVVSATDPMGNVRTTTYDAMDHVTCTTVAPPAGKEQSRTFTYNALGFLISKSEPETGYIEFGPKFDVHGLPLTITEYNITKDNNRVRNLHWDGLGRLRSRAGGSVSEAFNYDGLFLSGTSRGVGNDVITQQFFYDGPGARLSQETTTGAVTGAW